MSLTQRIFRLLLAILILIVGVGGLALLLWRVGAFDQINSFKEFGNSPYGWIMFYLAYLMAKFTFVMPLGPIVITFNQISPDVTTFVIASLAEITGAIILYSMGKSIGSRLIKWLADEKTLNKWNSILKKGKYTIFLTFLFPFFPNQLIMLLCGSGKMPFKQFIIMILIAQPIGVIATIFFGKAIMVLNPLWLWIPIGTIIMALLAYVSIRHQDKIDWLFEKLKIN